MDFGAAEVVEWPRLAAIDSGRLLALSLLAVCAAAALLCAALVLCRATMQCVAWNRMRNVPRPPERLLSGTEFDTQRFHGEKMLALQELHRKYGDTVGLRSYMTPSVSTIDPALLHLALKQENFPKPALQDRLVQLFGRGLVFLNGSTWSAHRRVLSSGFVPAQLRHFLPLFIHHADNLVAAIDAKRKAGEATVSTILSDDLTYVTLDIIAAAALRYPLNSVSGEHPDIASVFLKVMAIVGVQARVPSLFPCTGHLLRHRYRRWFAVLDRLLSNAIAVAKADPPAHDAPPRDLLDVIFSGRDKREKTLSDDDMKSELLTFFLAGHESTAISLTWVLYLLAKHPDVQRKVVDEIDGVMGSGPLTMVKLSMLTYQSQVIREALRLYPPVHVAERRAPRDIEFGDMLVPRNTTIVVPVYALHRSERYFERADEFDPDRMTDDFVQHLPDMAYIPFASGPRMCLGSNFFWTQARVLLCQLLRRFTIEPLDADAVLMPTTTSGGLMRPDRPLVVSLRPR